MNEIKTKIKITKVNQGNLFRENKVYEIKLIRFSSSIYTLVLLYAIQSNNKRQRRTFYKQLILYIATFQLN